MRRLFVRVMLSAVLAGFTASAQAQMEMPKPAPELKKLDYFAGNWKLAGRVEAPARWGPEAR